MREHTAEVVLEAGAKLGEGACWDHEQQLLYWLDILSCEVHIFDPAHCADRVLVTPCHVSLVHPTTRGDLILGTRDGIARMDPASGAIEFLIDPEADLPGNRFNDGKPDPAGRLFAGSLAYDGSAGHANLWRIETDFSCQRVVAGVGNSNGLGWSPDRKTMYYIDTKTARVDAFDYDVASGAIGNRRAVVAVPPEHGKPDGMTVDAEGCIWTALWNGWGVARWDPVSGQMLEKVHAPCPYVTCPSFGGPDLDILYFTTARQGSDQMTAAAQPLAGSLFAVRPGVCGTPGFRFGG